MQKVLLELLLLSSTALAVIGDGFIVLPVDKIQTGVGSSNFPNRVPIFDLVEGVSKSFQQDVENINNMIQPIFGNGVLLVIVNMKVQVMIKDQVGNLKPLMVILMKVPHKQLFTTMVFLQLLVYQLNHNQLYQYLIKIKLILRLLPHHWLPVNKNLLLLLVKAQLLLHQQLLLLLVLLLLVDSQAIYHLV